MIAQLLYHWALRNACRAAAIPAYPEVRPALVLRAGGLGAGGKPPDLRTGDQDQGLGGAAAACCCLAATAGRLGAATSGLPRGLGCGGAEVAGRAALPVAEANRCTGEAALDGGDLAPLMAAELV